MNALLQLAEFLLVAGVLPAVIIHLAGAFSPAVSERSDSSREAVPAEVN